MPKFFVKNNQIENNKINIIGEDVNHICNVLRMKKDEELTICDSDTSKNYLSKIDEINKTEVICEIIKEIDSKAESNVEVHIFQGLPKADKMELIIQKSVELGVKEITPVEMKRSIVKLDGKDKVKKVDRWNKIAEVAAKQSGRDIIPKINKIINVNEMVEIFNQYDIVLVCYENEKEVMLKEVLKKHKDISNIKIAVVVGPEGGIDGTEIDKMNEHNAQTVSLGSRILRTETVCLSILSIIMYEFE